MISPEDDKLVPERVARTLIARAAEIDAGLGDVTSLANLRDAAMQAGISAAAFDAALLEARLSTPIASAATPMAWASAWERLSVRVFARFTPGWLATMSIIGILSGTVFETGYGPRQLGLMTLSTLAVIGGHASALLLTSRTDSASRRGGGVQSVLVGALAPFVFVGLQLLHVIGSPMTYRFTSVVWFAISGVATLLIAAVGNPGPTAEAPPAARTPGESQEARTPWWRRPLWTGRHLTAAEPGT
jgi:hypothetical protein